jgi:hypothetical protein
MTLGSHRIPFHMRYPRIGHAAREDPHVTRRTFPPSLAASVFKCAGVALFAATAWTSPAKADGEDESVSFFALRNAGSARSVGLAGATVAAPADADSAFGNPASLVWQRGLLGVSYFSWSHSATDPAVSSVDAGEQEGMVVAGTLKPFESLAAGVGYASTSGGYSRAVHERSALDVAVEGSDLPLMASARIHERVSLGGGVTFSRRQYARGAGETRDATTRRARQEYAGRTWKVGLIGAVFDTLSAGFSYEAARELGRSGGEGDESSRPGRYVDPWVAKFGLCYLLAPTESSLLRIENTFFLGVDLLGFPGDAGIVRHPAATLSEETAALAWPGPRARADVNPARYDDGQRAVPRLGIETAWFRTNAAELSTWLGSWWEPAYVAGRGGAFHTTVGAQFSLWWLMVQGAVDISRDGPRAVLGAGIRAR